MRRYKSQERVKRDAEEGEVKGITDVDGLAEG